MLVLGLLLACSAHAADKPNIVFIMVDDLGSADLGFPGREDTKSANIDRLTKEDVGCESFYGMPVCTPAPKESTEAITRHFVRRELRSEG